MQDFFFCFLMNSKVDQKGLQRFDITTRWLLERLECKYSRLLVRRLVVWWTIKAGCIQEARRAAGAFKQCWPMDTSPFICALNN